MIVADNHVHTRFSPDGHEDPELFVMHALALGMQHICFTEHVDLLYYNPAVEKGDIDGYFSYVRKLKQKYADRLYIGVGLEMGYTYKNKEENARFLVQYGPDYVINSVHEVDGVDCYCAEYFTNKSPQQAYAAYLEAVEESLDAPYTYHAVGHLGYVCRNAPFDTSDFYAVMHTQIDRILEKTVAKQKILELNTSVRTAKSPTLPQRDIFMRYAAAGGARICFSSDAHRPEEVGRQYEVARALAAAAGIAEQTVIENGQEETLPF